MPEILLRPQSLGVPNPTNACAGPQYLTLRTHREREKRAGKVINNWLQYDTIEYRLKIPFLLIPIPLKPPPIDKLHCYLRQEALGCPLFMRIRFKKQLEESGVRGTQAGMRLDG